MKVALPLIHLDNLVFTPLPQLLLKQQLVLDGVCAPEDVTILEFSREDDLAASFSAIVEAKPDVVGFSCYVWNARAVRQLSKALKDYWGDKVKVVWGGPHVSEKPRWFAQANADCCDYVVGWYGELSFSQLVRMLQHGDPDPNKAPAYTSGSDGGPTKAPEFDELPLPYRKEWIPATTLERVKDRVALLETYRNCLVAGTMVTTLRGSVPIEFVDDKDSVLGRDREYHKVLRSEETMQVRDVLSVLFSSGSIVTGTPDHLVWTAERGWVALHDLKPADTAECCTETGMSWDGKSPKAWPILQTPRSFSEDVPVYDLKIEGSEEFFANGVLVHNCPFACEYCLWGKASNKIEGRSYYQVMEDFEHLLSLGFRHFKFADAGLGVVKKDNRDKRIWRTLADMGLHKRNINLRTYFFWQVIDDEWAEIFAKLISQGVIGTMDLGIQTFNPKALTDMKRPTDYDRFHRVIGILQRYKIPYSIDLILGLPGDDLEGFRHSVRKCIEYKPQRFQSFLCSVLPGAGYDVRRGELGIRTIAGSLMDDDEKVVETKTFPRDQVQAALDLEAWLYFAFSLQVCSGAIHKAAQDAEVNALSVVESLKSWCSKKAPHTVSAIQCYRRNLYDSRQKGRVQCDEYMAAHFKWLYLELMEWADLMGVRDEMRDGLLKFPKTRDTAQSLDGLDGISWDPYSNALRRDEEMHQWKEDPILGVIGTKYAFWTWDKVEVEEEVMA